MTVTFYTTHCPRCKVVEMKLKAKNIVYDECNDINEMLKLGATSAPLLKVDEKLMNFNDAIKWINTFEN